MNETYIQQVLDIEKKAQAIFENAQLEAQKISIQAEQEAQALIEKAFRCILHTHSPQDFARVDQSRAEELYSLDPQDYQEARRLILEALSGVE